MSWATAKGWNFRATAAFVTDGASQQGVANEEAYPTITTIGGDSVTWGWESHVGGNERDRDAAAQYAPELSGIEQLQNFDGAGSSVFRVDLPVPAYGQYNIRAAFGDAANAQKAFWDLVDLSTVLTSMTETAVATGQFYDATGALRITGTLWHSGNAPYLATFGTTVCRLRLNKATLTLASVIAHLSIQGLGAVVSAQTPSGRLATATSATVGCTTDTSSGTLYVVIDTPANLNATTIAQVKAGQNASGGAALASGNSAVTGVNPSVALSGLTAGVRYAYNLVQNDGTYDSVLLGGTFTTDYPVSLAWTKA